MTPSEILLKAADYLEEHGWCQGDYAKDVSNMPGSPCCVMGALNFAATGDITGDTEGSIEATSLFSLAIGTQCIIDWNDRPDRTKDKVVAKLREAAR